MNRPIKTTVFNIIVLAALTACGGGGGGGGNTIRDVPFTSFAVIGGNQRVTISGDSQTAQGTNTGIMVDSLTFNPVNEGNSTITLTYDRDRNLSGLSIGTPQSSVSYGADEVSCAAGAACGAVSPDFSSVAVVMNPFDGSVGWNYQTFGVWLKDITDTSFQTGAISAGAVTPASALPTGLLTDVTFTGHAGGFYYNGAGALFTTDAPMTAVTNFQARTIDFRTDGTLLVNLSTLQVTTDTGLDLRGTWSYGLGTSQFSLQPVTTVNSNLSGNASGRFFGPNAEEIGGVYGLSSTDPTIKSWMIGGFGGKRP